MTDSVQAPKRMDQLQFFRALGFFLIYCRHTQGTFGMNFPELHKLALTGNQLAVLFFFILSGFLKGYASYGREVTLSLKAVWTDFSKKLKRIYPLHFAVCLFALAGTGSVLDAYDSGQMAIFKDRFISWIQQTLLVHAWSEEHCLDYNYASWFLSVLMFVVLLDVPATWLLHKWDAHKKAPYIYAGILAILMLIEVIIHLRTNDYPYYNLVFPPTRISEYLLGITLGYFLRSIYAGISKTFNYRILWTLVEAAAVAFVIYGELHGTQLQQWLLPIVLLIFVFAFGRGYLSMLLKFPLFVLLGDLVFPCYILHPMIISAVMHTYTEAGTTPMGINILFFYTLALLYVLAYILTYALPGKKPGFLTKTK